MPDNEVNKILGELRLGFDELEKDAAKAESIIDKMFADMNSRFSKGNPAADYGVSKMTALQAAKVKAIAEKTEAEKTAILQKGEAQREAILKRAEAPLESRSKRDLAIAEKTAAQVQAVELENAAKISEIRSRQSVNEAKEMQEIAKAEKIAAEKVAIERKTAAEIAEINARASISEEKALVEVAKYDKAAAEKVAVEQVANAKVKALRDMTEVSTQEKLAKTMAYVEKTNAAKVSSEEWTQARIEALNKKTQAQIEAIQNRSASNMEHRHNTMLGRMKSSFVHHLSFMATGAIMGGVGVPMYEGLVEMEKGMAGVAQVLPQLEHDQTLLNEVSEEYVNIMQRYGQNVQEVTDAAKLWGRQYKDIQMVQNLVNSTTLLSIVDNLSLEKSNQSLEATMNQYGMTARNAAEAQAYSMRIVDSWSNIAHNAQVSALDLAEANERTASVARKVGIEFDYLQGHITAAVRATGMPGANIGNMLKSVYGSIHSGKAVEEIEALGVKMKQAGEDGVESWRPVQDVIMDVIFATRGAKMDTEELTKAMAGGKFQWAKLAAMMGDFETMIKATALSIHSQGKTLEYAHVQMDTIERKAKQLKATLVDLFNEGGNDGLRTGLKATIDTLNQFIMGLKQVEPYAIKLAGLGAVGWGLVTVWKTMFTTLQPLVSSLIAARTATTALAAAETAQAATAVTATGAMTGLAIATGVATMGLSLLVGGIAAWIYKAGEAEKAEIDLKTAFEDEMAISQQKAMQYKEEADFLANATGYREKLIAKIKDEKLSANDLKKTKADLAAVEESMKTIVGEEAWARVQASKDKGRAIQDEINKIKDLEKATKDASIKKINTEIETTNKTIAEINKRISGYQTEISALMAKSSVKQYTDSLNQTKSAWDKEAVKDPQLAMRIHPPKSVAPLIQKTGELYNAEDVKKLTDLQNKQAADEKKLQDAIKNLETSKKNLMTLMGTEIPGVDEGGAASSGDTKTAAEKARDAAQAYVDAVESALRPYELSVERAANAVSALSLREQILQKQMEMGLGTANTTNELLKIRHQLLGDNTKQLSGYVWQQQALHNQAEAERKKLSDVEAALKKAHDPEVIKTLQQEIDNLNRSIAQAGQQYLQIDLQKLDMINRIEEAEKEAADAVKEHAEAEEKRWGDAYQTANDYARHEINMSRWTTEQQIEFYEKLRDSHDWTQREMWDTEENLFRLRRQQLDDFMDEMEKQYQSKLDEIDSRLKETTDELQRQMDALDREGTENDRESAKQDHLNKMTDLQEEYHYHELRTGKDHEKAMVDIKKQMDEENRRWQEQQNEWVIDDKKESLQDQIDDAQSAAEKERQNLENHYKQVVDLANKGALDTLAALSATNPKWMEIGKNWIQNLMDGISSKESEFQETVEKATSQMDGYKKQSPKSGSGSVSPGGAVDKAKKEKAGITLDSGDFSMIGNTAVMWSRDLADLLDVSVDWDDKKKKVEIGDEWFAPLRNDNGKTYVSIREVAEELGYKVDWDASKREIDIYKAAKGGIFMDPSFIQVAEAGYPEVVLPVQNIQPMINSAVNVAVKPGNDSLIREIRILTSAVKANGGMKIDKLLNIENANMNSDTSFGTATRQSLLAVKSVMRGRGLGG